MRSKGSGASSARSVTGGLDIAETGPLSPVKSSDAEFLERYKLRDFDSSSNGSNCWVSEGMDPTKAYRLVIRMSSYMSREDNGRVQYYGSKCIRRVVDRDELSLVVIADMLKDEFKWGSSQFLSYFFWDKCTASLENIRTDAALLDAFDMYFVERTIQINVNVLDVGSDWNGERLLGLSLLTAVPSQSSIISQEPVSVVENPSEQPQCEETMQLVPHSQGQCGGGTSQNVAKKKATRKKDKKDDKKDKEEEKKKERSGPDMNDEEYVGVDDEGIYGVSNEPVHIVINDDAGPSSKEEVDGQPCLVVDLESPTIKIGATFPDQTSFKIAIRHYAILNEFEFGIDYSDN